MSLKRTVKQRITQTEMRIKGWVADICDIYEIHRDDLFYRDISGIKQPYSKSSWIMDNIPAGKLHKLGVAMGQFHALRFSLGQLKELLEKLEENETV